MLHPSTIFVYGILVLMFADLRSQLKKNDNGEKITCDEFFELFSYQSHRLLQAQLEIIEKYNNFLVKPVSREY